MADDREVLREVWQGRIPTAFTLYQDDVEVIGQPDTYYLMLPRLSYISVVTDKVRKYFNKFLSEGQESSDMWFDYQGTPLKWHLPVGVLFDQICVNHNGNGNSSVLPPWNLTVHFGNFPQSEILKWDTKEAIESHFMSCIKEADQIKHGGRVVSSMQKKDHNQLWQGLHNDKFDQFWAVNRRLMDPRGAAGGGSGGNGGGSAAAGSSGSGSSGGSGGVADDDANLFKHIPFRFYESDRPVQQRLIKPNLRIEAAAAEEATSLSSSSNPAKPAGESACKRQTTLKDLLQEMVPDRPCHEIKVITQGISPELDTPLQWMSEHLSYPDNFLHICVR